MLRGIVIHQSKFELSRARFFFHCARFPVNSRNIVENIVHGLRRNTRLALITLMSVRISVPSISTANGISTGASIMANRLANPESSLWNVKNSPNRFHQALIALRPVVSQSDSAFNSAWRPAAMVEVDCDTEAPTGFTAHLMRGMRFRLNLLEPEESLATVEGWNAATEDLEPGRSSC